MTALLTDEKISQAADNAVECHENIACENEAAFYRVGYIDGIVFARSIYEARLAEAISLMKEAAPAIDTISFALSERFDRFLAIYTKEGKP